MFNLIPVPRIISMSPEEGGQGQTILVTVSLSSPFWRLFSAPSDISPEDTIIQFRGNGTTFINAITTRLTTSVVNLLPWTTFFKARLWTYRVVVPSAALSGPLRLIRGGSQRSVTTRNFLVRTAGITIGNLAQYNIVSILINGIERLFPQSLAAVPVTAKNINVADIGTSLGNHDVRVVFGVTSDQPIMSVNSPSVPAQNPFFEQPINPFTIAQFLAFPANSNSFGSASWQGLTFDVNGLPVAHGFDFVFNTQSGISTYAFWQGDRTNQISNGNIREPLNWPINAATVDFQLVRNNGSLDFQVQMDMVGSSFIGPFGVPCVRQP